MNFSGRKLILSILYNHSCQFCEVLRDFWCTIVHYKEIVAPNYRKEPRIVIDKF